MRFIYTSAMLSNGALILAETSAFLVASRSQLNMLMRVVGLRQHVAPCSTSGTTSNSYKVCIRQSGRAAGCTTMMSEQTKSSEGKFVRMGSAEDTHSFGPRCVVAAGLPAEDNTSLLSILQAEEEGSPPLVLYTSEISRERVGDVLGDAEAISRRQETQVTSGRQSAPTLASPVILVSGFTNPELRGFVARCRQVLSVRAAFAKAVPNAMEKPMSHLCSEIAQDHADALAGKLEGGPP